MRIDQLQNFGPKSQAMLAAAGIDTLQQLRELGAIAAYLKVKRTGANASMNLLYAMEGALTERDWRLVAREDRLRLALELEAAQSEVE